jgi:hypothetical protein
LAVIGYGMFNPLFHTDSPDIVSIPFMQVQVMAIFLLVVYGLLAVVVLCCFMNFIL